MQIEIRGRLPNMSQALDQLVERSLRELASDTHVWSWQAKENDWVNYFAHKYLIQQCSPTGPLKEPGQIGIEQTLAAAGVGTDDPNAALLDLSQAPREIRDTDYRDRVRRA